MAGPIRVLLVDDDPSLADLMASQLRSLREEFSIRIETDPNDALDVVDADDVDCVVSDYHMPEMNGLELLRYVREMEPNMPFILFTARGSEEIASDAVSEGVTDYFRKRRGSEQWRVLANRIENVAAKYRAEQAVQRREAALQQLARTVIDSVSTPVEELLELGRETLKVEYAALLQGEGTDAELAVESADPTVTTAASQGIPLANGVDDLTVEGGGIVTATADQTGDDGFSSYIGVPVYVGDGRYGTICFCDRGQRSEFTAWERAFVELLGDWLGHELTSEQARDRSEAVRSAQDHLDRAREALEAGEEATVGEELDAIAELLEQEPPSTMPVSIELS
jgi:CheY-like chemotaxis protein